MSSVECGKNQLFSKKKLRHNLGQAYFILNQSIIPYSQSSSSKKQMNFMLSFTIS